jgi:hypothetical protein
MAEVVVTFVRVPQAAPEHPAPERDQATPLFCESFCAEAVKFAAVETCTEVDVGLMETAMGGAAVTVMIAGADFEPSATEVAVSVTVGGVGTLAGAR